MNTTGAYKPVLRVTAEFDAALIDSTDPPEFALYNFSVSEATDEVQCKKGELHGCYQYYKIIVLCHNMSYNMSLILKFSKYLMLMTPLMFMKVLFVLQNLRTLYL